MNRVFRNACVVKPSFCSLTLLLLISATALGQEKKTVTWLGLDLNAKVVSDEVAKNEVTKKEVVKTVQPKAINPEKRKSIWNEPAWYVALGGAAFDVIGAAVAIDGKRVIEGNPLLRGKDGKAVLAAAIPLKAAGLYLQYRAYKNPKHRKLAIIGMLASGILQGTLGGARAFAMR